MGVKSSKSIVPVVKARRIIKDVLMKYDIYNKDVIEELVESLYKKTKLNKDMEIGI